MQEWIERVLQGIRMLGTGWHDGAGEWVRAVLEGMRMSLRTGFVREEFYGITTNSGGGKLFLEVFYRSMIAGGIVVAVLFLRMLLKRAPKLYSYLLWGLVLYRLLCPFTFVSPFSFLGAFGETDSVKLQTAESAVFTEMQDEGAVHSPQAFPADGERAGAVRQERSDRQGYADWSFLVAFHVWAAGIGAMLLYGAVSLLLLCRRLRGAVKLRENIYLSDYVPTPFVIGLVRPRIYLPSSLQEKEMDYIILHERTHIRRGDHIIRMLSFLTLCVYWFHPLIWAAYYLSGKDMEMSCDEAVMRKMDGDIRADYSTSLLKLSAGRFFPGGTPLAFGEGNTKKRIENVMRWRKPKPVVVGIAVVVIVAAAVYFGTDPKAAQGADGGHEQASNGEHLRTEGGASVQAENGEALQTAGQETGEPGQTGNEGGGQTADEKTGLAGIEETLQTADADVLQEENGQAENGALRKAANEWAWAYCGRDGNTIVNLSTQKKQEALRNEELLSGQEREYSFGWSSPWPWDSKTDYRILKCDETDTIILYYAWTSVPHVTVWEERIMWEREDGTYKVSESVTRFLDSISDSEGFEAAYGAGINGTPIDYLTNGAGEALNENALENREYYQEYEDLFMPETAARLLLNLSTDEGAVAVSAGSRQTDGSVEATVSFAADGGSASVKMIQPYGEDGIWIVQDGGK